MAARATHEKLKLTGPQYKDKNHKNQDASIEGGHMPMQCRSAPAITLTQRSQCQRPLQAVVLPLRLPAASFVLLLGMKVKLYYSAN